MKRKLIEYAKSLLNLVYPKQCLYCQWDLLYQEEILCTHCRLRLPKVTFFHHHPSLKNIFFGRCDWQHGLLFLRMEKSGMVKSLLHDLKYRNHPELGTYLGKLWAKDCLLKMGDAPWDCIVPVPLHPKKQVKRGYNQCSVIAHGMSSILGIPVVENVLVRQEAGMSQTFQSRWGRNNKASNPFAVRNEALLKGKRILVLDDVVTTGATLVYCYMALKEISGVQLSISAMAIPVHNRIVV
ncbi:MAG: hypothetical protein RL062_333 [Bacteroidota bacterium]